MTRKDLIRIIYSYKGLLEEKDKLEKSIGNSKKIDEKDIIKGIISSVLRNTSLSSNIWVCIGAFKTNDINAAVLERYYCFTDLETCKERVVSSLEYGEFCRNNSVIMLESYFEKFRKEFGFGIEGFNILRNNFILEISFYLLNRGVNNINIDDFENHYNRIVNRYKKDGKLTTVPIGFTRK